MAVPGPTDRTFTIDTSADVPTDVTACVVGEVKGLGTLEESLSDLTGPASTAPVFLPAGFTDGKTLGFTFSADVGGTPDPVDMFYTDHGTARDIAIVYQADWTFSSAAYITKVQPILKPKELALLEVEFTLYGTATVT